VERTQVLSSNVASMGYDERTQTLEVEFRNGSVYQYYNVPGAVFDAFAVAASKGQFLNENIRNQYPFSRV
jgi:hypothetical protein